MKKFVLVFVLAFGALLTTMGQTNSPDVVHLTNGSYIKGEVIEYMVDEYVKIMSVDGKVHEIKAEDVTKINRKSIRQVGVKEKGFFNATSIGMIIGQNNYGSLVNLSFNTVNGFQFKQRFQAGIGTGLDLINDQLHFPFTADFKYAFFKGATTPYIGVNGGYMLPMNNGNNYNPYYYYYPTQYKGGFTGGFEIGFRNFSNEHMGMTFALGYKTARMEETYYDYYYEQEVYRQTIINRFRLSIGFVFN